MSIVPKLNRFLSVKRKLAKGTQNDSRHFHSIQGRFCINYAHEYGGIFGIKPAETKHFLGELMQAKIKEIFFVVTLLITSVGYPQTSFAAEQSIPCGDGATYQVLMPEGVVLGGSQCSGSVTLVDGVKTIDAAAFRDSKITSLKMPNSVTTIGGAAFYGSKQLSEVILSNSITRINSNTFSYTNIKSLTIPNSVKVLEREALARIGLTTVKLSSELESIGDGALMLNPITSITIPSSVRTIGIAAFLPTNLTTITIPKSVTRIEGSMFQGVPLTSINLPDSITYIGENVFEEVKLTSIKLPKSLKFIGSGAFGNVTTITSLTIPDGVEEIGDYAFAGMTKLNSVSLPTNLKILGQDPFNRNYSLKIIKYCGGLQGFPIKPTCSSSGISTSPSPSTSRKPIGGAFVSSLIKCSDGKKTITVMGKNPICPKGYTKK